MQRAPNCDLALIHDDDLQLCIDGAVCSSIVLVVLSQFTLVVTRFPPAGHIYDFPSEVRAESMAG